MQKIQKTLSALFLVVFIDGLGQGLLFPILTKVLSDPNSQQLISTSSASLRELAYGVTVGVFFLSAFIGATVLGDLSDSLGRRRTLMLCLAGSAFGFLLSVAAFIAHSLTLMIIGRVIDGFTAGSQPIASAAIVDVAEPSQKSRYIGYVLLAVSLGLVAGPVIGGVLSNHHLVSWFTNKTPLYFAAALSVINIFMLQYSFTDTNKQARQLDLNWRKPFELLAIAFGKKEFRLLSASYFFMQMAFNGFYIYSAMFLVKKFNFTATHAGFFVGLIGVGLLIGFLFLVKRVEGKLPDLVIGILGYCLLGIGILLSTLFNTSIIAWLLVIPSSAAFAVGVSFYLTEYSNRSPTNFQGQAMGIANGVSFLAIGLVSLLIGYLGGLSYNLPFASSVVMVVIGSLIGVVALRN